MIGVKNNSDKEIVGRYDGKDYTFPPGIPVAVPQEAAVHIFGLGQEDKTRALARLGWLRNQEQYATSVKRLDDIQFLQVESKFLGAPQQDEGIMMAGGEPNAPESKIKIPQFAKSGK